MSAINVQVSQEYENMDMTKERNSLIFELRSMFLSSQMILKFVSAAMAWPILLQQSHLMEMKHAAGYHQHRGDEG